MKDNPKLIYAILFLLILFYGVNNYFLVKSFYAEPLYADEAHHLITALSYHQIFKSPSLDIVGKILEINTLYPPLLFVPSAIITVFAGFSKLNAVMANMFFFLILILSVYSLGKKISGSKHTGLFAVFILSMFPMIYGMSRYFMLDFALTAIVALAICCLVYTDNFRNTPMCLFFGASAGLAVMTKCTAPAFILVPALYVFFTPLSKFRLQSRKLLLNLLYALIIFYILTAFWYNYYNSQPISPLPCSNITSKWQAANIRMCERQFFWNSIDGLLYYARSLFPYQVSLIFSLIFVLGLYFFIKSRNAYRLLIFSWIIAPYIILTVFDNKWARFIMPVLPAIALIMAVGISQIRFGGARKAMVHFIIILGLIQYSVISYVPRENMRNANRFIENLFYVNRYSYSDYFDLNCLTYRDKWYKQTSDATKQIIGRIRACADSIALNKMLNVGVIWPSAVNRFRYLSLLQQLGVRLYAFYEEPKLFLENIDDLDIIILRTPTGIWPEEAEIKRAFKSCNLQERFGFEDKEYIEFDRSLSRLSSEFTPVRLFRNQQDPYVYLLIKNKYNTGRGGIDYLKNKATIGSGPLRATFADGSGRIYHNNSELTKDLGINIYLLSEGREYSSVSTGQIIWDIKRVSPKKLSAKGRWLNLAIAHILEFEIENSTTINCKIITQVYEDINLSEQFFILMLSDIYGEYIIPRLGIQGRFPRGHKKSSDEWEKVWCETIELAPSIGVINGLDNKVILDCSLMPPGYDLIVSNTDNEHRARALIYVEKNRRNRGRLPAGKYLLFEGKIKIE